MVSDHTDDGALRWLQGAGIDLLRGTGRLAGTGAVEVDGVRHTADHVVVACGADPVIPPIPGLRELDGIWTNREATAMEEVPRRLLILGGGPVGVEMAQAVRRLGGEVVLVEGAEHLLAREPALLGEALGDALRHEGSSSSSARTRQARGARARTTSSRCRRPRAARRASAGGHGRRPRVEGIGLETVGIEPDAHGIPVDGRLRAGERLWACGDITGIFPLTHVGKYQGEVVAANILGVPREANYDAVPRVTYTDPQAACGRRDRSALQRDRPRDGGREDRHLHARLRGVQRVPHAAQRRRAADRRLRARPRSRRVAPAGDARHQARASRSACCATRSSRSRRSRRSTSGR
jgi:dihydrolipoamide dehydrogenase